MAQKSIHVLNKSGYSMFWNSMWDDKINFSKSLKKQIFLQFFFESVVEDYNSINFFKKFKKFFKKKFKKNSHPFKKKKLNFLHFFWTKKQDFNYNNFFFNSKIWVLKYQNWFIIFFFIFDLKKLKRNKSKNPINFNNDLNLFLQKSLKLNFNFNNACKKNNYNF